MLVQRRGWARTNNPPRNMRSTWGWLNGARSRALARTMPCLLAQKNSCSIETHSAFLTKNRTWKRSGDLKNADIDPKITKIGATHAQIYASILASFQISNCGLKIVWLEFLLVILRDSVSKWACSGWVLDKFRACFLNSSFIFQICCTVPRNKSIK